MDWTQLMSSARVAGDGTLSPATPDSRNPFEMDWDRIVFSTAFRRLHDKTQVFPLPEDDVVHSRLTHSLEVASVGRSLGTRVGERICGRRQVNGLRPAQFGDVVAAACLAHDIGNPPFGHAGEDAIRKFFCGLGVATIADMHERERSDFTDFEGNAQGFRILTRLQFGGGGLRLTAATLGAFLKYPRQSGADLKTAAGAASKKHGAFQSELEILSCVAAKLGLPPAAAGAWGRHPLAYMVEAADDICNALLDLEDGARLGHVPSGELNAKLRLIAAKAPNYSDARCSALAAARDQTAYLRALTIGVLVDDCAGRFADVESDLLAGKNLEPLAEGGPFADSRRSLLDDARDQCYHASDVLEIELAGYRALSGLLEAFAEGACTPAVVGATGNGLADGSETRWGMLPRSRVFVRPGRWVEGSGMVPWWIDPADLCEA